MTWAERIRLLGAPGPHMAGPPRAGAIISRHEAAAIIVGIEGSERSADALALADLLAGSLAAPLVFVHNRAHGTSSNFFVPREGGPWRDPTTGSVLARVQKLSRRHHDASVRVTHASSPAEALQECAAAESAQLIIVGPSWRHMLPGSVGEQLLFGARVPVAIAPRGYADKVPSLNLVVSAFDGSPESRRGLEWASRLARGSDRQLRVISVHAPTLYGGFGFPAASVDPAIRDGLEHELSAAIAGHDGPVEAIVPDGEPGSTLVEASQEADILAMGSRGHRPLRSALLGSVSHHVMRHAACPVVILPPGANLDHGPIAGQEPAVRDAAA